MRTACWRQPGRPFSLVAKANHRNPAQAAAMSKLTRSFSLPGSATPPKTPSPQRAHSLPAVTEKCQRMLRPCPGVVSRSSPPSWTTWISSVSSKQPAHTNYPVAIPSPPFLQQTPANPSLGIPYDPQPIIHSRPSQDRERTFPAIIMADPGQHLVYILHGPYPHAQIPHTSVSLASFLKNLSCTSINSNQGLGSFPGTVPTTISNATRKNTHLAAFHEPFTVRLGRGLQLLR